MSDSPLVRACSAFGGSMFGSSGGALRIIPSSVPGVEIERATWKSNAKGSVIFLAAAQTIEYHVGLHSDNDSLDRRIALLYEARDRDSIPALRVDDRLNVDSLRGQQAAVSQGAGPHATRAQFQILTPVHVASGLFTRPFSAQQACPFAVRVIPRHDLPLYSQAGASASDSRETLAERMRTRTPFVDTGAVRVLAVTRSQPTGANEFGVVAINATDTALTDIVIALAVGSLDTMEYFVSHIPARGIVARQGGFAGLRGEVTPLTYRADRVRGRLVSSIYRDYRVSQMGRIAKLSLVPERQTANVGTNVHLFASPGTADGYRDPDFDKLPVHWTIEPAGLVGKVDTLPKLVINLHVERAGQARVTVDVGGVTASTNILFKAP